MVAAQDDNRVSAAARWLSEQTQPPSNPIPTIRGKFSLNALQACEACKVAQTIRSGRAGNNA